MGFHLIPERRRGEVIIQGLILSIGPPAQILDRHFQILMKVNGVGHMPAIEAPLASRLVILALMIQRITQIECGISSWKSVVRTKIIFGAGAGDRSEIPCLRR